MEDKTDFKAISNFISDAFMYFGDTTSFSCSSDEAIVYDLLCIADNICLKHFKK